MDPTSEINPERNYIYHDYCFVFAVRGIILNQKIFFVNEIFLTDKMTELFSLSESQ